MDGGGNARAPPLALDEEAVESVLQSSLGSPEAEACQRECTELGLCCVAVLNVLPSASGTPLIMEQLTPSKPRQRCVNMHVFSDQDLGFLFMYVLVFLIFSSLM